MNWIARTVFLLVGFILGTMIPTTNAQRLNLGLSDMDMMMLIAQSEERQRVREQTEREFDARMELKRKAEKLNRLYEDVRDVWQAAVTEQQRQIEQQASGVYDIKQDVIVAKLTQEMADKATEIAKLNRIKR